MSTPESRVIRLQRADRNDGSTPLKVAGGAPTQARPIAETLGSSLVKASAVEQQLADATTCEEIWELLSHVQQLPARSVDTELVFNALRRLSRSDSVFLRSAAYRWLAGLHRIDLRFEMRAKRLLFLALERETGAALLRVTQLLRHC